MPYGKGTYGNKVGRPPNKKKRMRANTTGSRKMRTTRSR